MRIYNLTHKHEHYDNHGLLHKEDGPAMIFKDGSNCYLIHGEFHRLDGPACEYSNGYKEWYLNGKQIPVSSQEEFERYLKLLVFI